MERRIMSVCPSGRGCRSFGEIIPGRHSRNFVVGSEQRLKDATKEGDILFRYGDLWSSRVKQYDLCLASHIK